MQERAHIQEAMAHITTLEQERTEALELALLAEAEEAEDLVQEALSSLNVHEPAINIVNNVDVTIETQGDAIKNALVRQLYCPVQWTRTVEYLAAAGVERVIEVGPGKVLTGLNKRIDKSLASLAVNTPDGVEALK